MDHIFNQDVGSIVSKYLKYPYYLHFTSINDIEFSQSYLKIDPFMNNAYALRNATLWGHCSVVEYMLRDPRLKLSENDRNCHLVGLAAQGGHIDMVRLLLREPRLNPAALDNYAIERALDINDIPIIMELLNDQRVKAALTHSCITRLLSRSITIKEIYN